MSRVFVAEETALHRTVVIKVLPPETAAQVSLERFKREILLAAKLQHPHIVPVVGEGRRVERRWDQFYARGLTLCSHSVRPPHPGRHRAAEGAMSAGAEATVGGIHD